MLAHHQSAVKSRANLVTASSCPVLRTRAVCMVAMKGHQETQPAASVQAAPTFQQMEHAVQPSVSSSIQQHSESAAGAAAGATAAVFKVGDLVDVRKHGRAVIVEGPNNEPGSEFYGRFRVQYDEDGSMFWVTPARLRHRVLATSRIVVARYTAEYRQAALHNVGRQDVCMEIGCHEGLTTFILSKRCRGIVGVDLSSHVVQLARKRYPELKFQQLDGNDVAGAQVLLATAGLPPLTKALIDISGQAPLQDLLPLLDCWLQATPHALIIVKNRALHCAVSAMQQMQHTTTDAMTLQHCVQASQLASDSGCQASGTPAGFALRPPCNLATQELQQQSQQPFEVHAGLDDGQEEAGVAVQRLGFEEVATLLLGASTSQSQGHAALRQLLLKVCRMSEVFEDPSTSHEKRSAQGIRDGLQQGVKKVAGQHGQSAVEQAAKVAKEAADKALRLQAKRERRAAKKLQQ